MYRQTILKDTHILILTCKRLRVALTMLATPYWSTIAISCTDLCFRTGR